MPDAELPDFNLVLLQSGNGFCPESSHDPGGGVRRASRRPDAAADAGSRPPSEMIVSYTMTIDGDMVMAAKDTARLSAKFQISIPKAIRTARRWQAGQVFAFVPKGEGMMLVPVPALDELAGLARGAKRGNYRDRTDRV